MIKYLTPSVLAVVFSSVVALILFIKDVTEQEEKPTTLKIAFSVLVGLLMVIGAVYAIASEVISVKEGVVANRLQEGRDLLQKEIAHGVSTVKEKSEEMIDEVQRQANRSVAVGQQVEENLSLAIKSYKKVEKVYNSGEILTERASRLIELSDLLIASQEQLMQRSKESEETGDKLVEILSNNYTQFKERFPTGYAVITYNKEDGSWYPRHFGLDDQYRISKFEIDNQARAGSSGYISIGLDSFIGANGFTMNQVMLSFRCNLTKIGAYQDTGNSLATGRLMVSVLLSDPDRTVLVMGTVGRWNR